MNQIKDLSTKSKKEGTFIIEKHYKVIQKPILYTNFTLFPV